MATEQEDRPGVSADWATRARAAGWGGALIERIEALRVPRSIVTDWLSWEQPEDRVVQSVDRYEHATFGPLRQREATAADNEKLAELFAGTSERIGDWDVVSERSPYAYAQFRLQENVQVQVLEEQGVLVAVIARSTRPAVVAGTRLNIRFSSAARVHPSGRGRGFSAYVRSATPAYVPYTNADYWYFRTRNFTARDWLRRDSPNRLSDAPEREDDVPGIPVTVTLYAADHGEPAITGVRPLRAGDVEECIALINRTHEGQDLFRPYTHDFFEQRMNDGGWGAKPPWWTPVYGRADYWVLEDSGRIVACGGLWDRGRHLRERWRHRESGAEETVARTALLDFGYAEGRADAMAALIDHLRGLTGRLGRSHLMTPLQQLPEVSDRLVHLEPLAETWSMQWEYMPPAGSEMPERLTISRPYTDLVYW